MKLLLALGLLLPSFATSNIYAETRMEITAQALQQGGFMRLAVAPGSTVQVGGVALPVVENGATTYALLGFDRFEPAARWLKVCPTNNPCQSQKVSIKPRTYDTQNVQGVPKAKVEPDAAASQQMVADNTAINAARAATAQAATRGAVAGGLGFTEAFGRPSPGRISGVYGSRRLFDGQERSWHKGLDYATPTGTPVVAPAAGVVRLARNTFMSGNLVMLDHGANMSSVYAHLNSMNVQAGQVVEAGETLGEVGTTGRSSGPHLHWGLYVGKVAIDPKLWVRE